MQIVISHAYTWDDPHTQAYIELSESFNGWLEACDGFVSRSLVADFADRTHLINLRVWQSISHYEAIINEPEYRSHIAGLSEHVDPSRYNGSDVRSYGDIVVTTEDAWRISS